MTSFKTTELNPMELPVLISAKDADKIGFNLLFFYRFLDEHKDMEYRIGKRRFLIRDKFLQEINK